MTEYSFGSEKAVVGVHVRAHEISLPMDYGSELDSERLVRRAKYMDMNMLFGRMSLMAGNAKEMVKLLLDFHTRLSLSLSPFSFFLLGLPFGIRGRRSELSVGLLMCVILALGFYVFLLMADAF